MSKLAPLAGTLIAATGAAHFVTPQTFASINEAAFPENTGEWIKRNGATEVALGLGLLSRRTRKLATVGLVAYTSFLGSRVAAHRAG
ncbi:hypothetical protein KV097_08365 [Mumia sp. zg.B17]|uniref:hypothetical protein n=1 Tax=Mumia sp. zg.B17 TaxID=2855446 RepID=UPI001C6F105E|nr:hypothetical protein [Mumia sp. zg.B17]MBW9205959.1 hypothetical protein [Mumia sp. zg.B17]